MIPEHSTDHVARGVAKLLGRFHQSEKLKGLLSTWLQQGQVVEDFIWLVLDSLSIESDVDIVLDRIGKIVGRGRNGLTNELYRYALRAQIRINRAHGRIEDLLDVMRLTAHDDAVTFGLHEQFPAALQLDMFGLASGPQVLEVWNNAKQTKAGGVRLFFTYSGGDATNDFLLGEDWGDADAVESDEIQGLGWTVDSTLGGKLAGEFVL